MTIDLVDIGANLGHASFGRDRARVIERAFAAGVRTIVVTGTSLDASRSAIGLARAHSGSLYATVGVHPHDAKRCDERTLAALCDLAAEPEAVAVGECGLDFNRDFSPRPAQERWFEAQVELACDLVMPLFLHEREAHARFVAILRRHRDRLPAAVVHCFTGTAAELDAYLDMDLHVGITGWICDERRGRDLLPHVVREVARCMGKPVDEVAAATTRTAQAFFGFGCGTET
jgi:TatD DNase family protein